MLNVILTASVSFIITFLAIPAIIKIAELKKLYDLPDARKLHTNPISSLGGIGIFGGFFLASILSVSSGLHPEFQYFFAASLIIFFLGIKDDLMVLSATKKFVGQVIAAAILIHLAGIKITSMHGFLGFTELPEAFSLALSYITIIVIINAFNLIDGVDGLAGTLGMLTMTIFGSYFFMVGLEAYSILAFSLAGSLLAFLIFNYNPAKIFMGDSGSLVLGLINAILVIKFITIADSVAAPFPIESAVAVGFAILMVPLSDTLRVFSIRIFQGRSPFSPDRNHIHHLLLDRGLNHKYVTLSCLLLNMFFITVAYFGRALGPTWTMFTIVSLSVSGLGMLLYLKKPVRPVIAPYLNSNKTITEPSVQPFTRIIPINSEAAVAENN
ncbi:MAG: undecaprenyl/decaprenyl-phosphate alpha-N-acetylglucosaminyl 1-phosphate transferase [Flavisolibacter sp.]|nr:undecaprenyl/decaprenyl-phosphate alpha-N-acetylglucosaminyl 1-phosphate transferase [Flavisolibacter sp.]